VGVRVTNDTRDLGTLGSDALGRQENPRKSVSYIYIYWLSAGLLRVGEILIGNITLHD
jgi:hypothetical protein